MKYPQTLARTTSPQPKQRHNAFVRLAGKSVSKKSAATMHCRGALLLAATILLSSVNGHATGITNMVTPNVAGVGIPSPRAAAQYGAPIKRMLRTVNPEDEGEDRIFRASPSGYGAQTR
ncbi:hypothetical protein ON010_g16096 [Phytophthora cinnamomi]|nr:hypothetical protein ON010_g16096 [Phytophthora cinnamomi]